MSIGYRGTTRSHNPHHLYFKQLDFILTLLQQFPSNLKKKIHLAQKGKVEAEIAQSVQ